MDRRRRGGKHEAGLSLVANFACIYSPVLAVLAVLTVLAWISLRPLYDLRPLHALQPLYALLALYSLLALNSLLASLSWRSLRPAAAELI